MDAYERSLKQQADRIRRELSQEGKKGAPELKPEPKDEFIPSDVPSPIYGYARPKPKINLPVEHSPETRDDLSVRQARRVAQPVERVAADTPTPTVPTEPELNVEEVVEEPTAIVEETTIEAAEVSVDEVEPPAVEAIEKSVAEQAEAPSETTVESTEADVDETESPASEQLEEIVTEQAEAPSETTVESTEAGVGEVEPPAVEAIEESVAEQAEAPSETTVESTEADVDETESPASEQLEEIVTEQAETSSEETIISTETIEESPLVSEDESAEQDTKPLLGEVSILESGFASVFMGSTDLKSSKIAVREEKPDVKEEGVSLEAQVETVAPIVEDVAKTLQTDDPIVLPDEAELTPAMSVSYKAEGPPLNVMMTPQDRMAMYKSRRLAKKNNNL